jgi:hypothetical protein
VSCGARGARRSRVLSPACPAAPRAAPQLELERKLRALLTKDKEKAQEEAALALGLCGTGGTMLP